MVSSKWTQGGVELSEGELSSSIGSNPAVGLGSYGGLSGTVGGTFNKQIGSLTRLSVAF